MPDSTISLLSNFDQLIKTMSFITKQTKFLDIKNEDGSDKDGAFYKVYNYFFNFMAFYGCHIATGNGLLHYIHEYK